MEAKKEARAPGSEHYEPAKQKQKEPASSEASVNKEANSTDPNSIDKKRDEEKGNLTHLHSNTTMNYYCYYNNYYYNNNYYYYYYYPNLPLT